MLRAFPTTSPILPPSASILPLSLRVLAKHDYLTSMVYELSHRSLTENPRRFGLIVKFA